MRKKLPVVFLCYRITGIINELNRFLNAEQRKGERLLRRRKKKNVHNGYKHWRKIGKPRKETSHLVASPATAMKLVKRGKKREKVLPTLHC